MGPQIKGYKKGVILSLIIFNYPLSISSISCPCSLELFGFGEISPQQRHISK